VFDILWSDPQHTDGCVPNSLRGAGTYFGPDVTEKFLQRNKLQFLVRSHECKPDGHEIMHSGKVSFESILDFLIHVVNIISGFSH
jgi:serine/threonine-protein phosphatase with EF-hands